MSDTESGSMQRRHSSRDGNNNTGNSPAVVSIIEQELREQKIRDLEIAAMYQARLHLHETVVTPPPNDVTPTPAGRQSSHSISAPDDVIINRSSLASAGPEVVSERPIAQGRTSSSRDGDGDVRQGGEGQRSSREMSFSSPGEALVYREMLESKQREAELKRYWKEIGILQQLPVSTPTEPDIRVADVPETAVARPEKSAEPEMVNGGAAATGNSITQRQSNAQSTSRYGSEYSEPRSRDAKSGARSEIGSGKNVDEGRHSSVWSPGVEGAASASAGGVELNEAASSGGRARRSRTEAELIIEREVAETRRREAELRKLREEMFFHAAENRTTT